MGRSENQDGRPSLWLAERFLTSQKLLNGVQRNLTGSKISTSSTNFVFFGLIGKTRWPPWPLIGWDIFLLLLWNRWTKFNETWQEARSQCLLPMLCFWSRRIDKNCCPGRSSVKKVAHCTQVHDMWPFGPLVSVWNRLTFFDRFPKSWWSAPKICNSYFEFACV